MFKRLVALLLVFLVFSLSPATVSGLIIQEESEAKLTVMSKISDDLFEVIKEENRTISLAVWLKGIKENDRQTQLNKAVQNACLQSFIDDELPYIKCDGDKEKNTEVNEKTDQYVHIKRQVEKELNTSYNDKVIQSIQNVEGANIDLIYSCRFAPLLLINVNSESVFQVARLNEVQNLYYYDPNTLLEINDQLNDEINSYNLVGDEIEEETESESYGFWQNNTRLDVLREAYHYTGDGVNIGLIQNYVPNFEYNGISPEKQAKLYALFDYSITNNLLHYLDSPLPNHGDDHANYMLSILTGFIDGTYIGAAPFADVYCAQFNYTSGVGYFLPMENLVDAGVNVICASIAMGATNYQYDFNARFLDYLISHSGVTICISTGNGASDGVHNGALAYNAISTGNIDDKNTSTLIDDTIRYTSNYTSHDDSPYKPDLSAPGAWTGTYTHPVTNNSYGGGGTSAAAAVMAGVCAILMQAYPSLKINPILLKSALMASAKKLPSMADVFSVSSSIEPALLREYGSGMVDCAYAYYILNQNRYLFVNSSNPDETEFTFRIRVTSITVANSKSIYVCLNWLQLVDQAEINNYYYNNSYYTVYTGIHHTLELYDTEGVLVARSDYSYDRKQFIRYKPLHHGYYTVKIKRNTTGTPDYYPCFAAAYLVI